jgi:hypothetical protein
MNRKLRTLALYAALIPAIWAFEAPGWAAPLACGTTFALTGDNGDWRAPVVKCTDANPVVVDASAATFRTIRAQGTQGVTIRGGTVGQVGYDGPAVTVDGSRYIRITGMTFTGAKVGATLVRGSDYVIEGSRFDGLRSDGVNINQAQRVTIDGNTFVNFRPIPQVYDAKGKLLQDGDHADAVQAYSFAGQPAVAALAITNNAVFGHAQGFDNFGDAQGIDGLIVRGNTVVTDYWQAISFANVKNADVRDNTVRALPNARAAFYPFQRVSPWIRLPADAKACGNTATERTSSGLTPC